jgi:hypothetical protein
MTKHFNAYRNLLAALFLSLSILSCSKNDDGTNVPAASEIAASEQLVIPASIAVPANQPGGNTRIGTFYATGIQQYKSKEVEGNPGLYEWYFVAPEATLYNSNNKLVGTHGAGPFWALTPQDSIYAQHYSPAKFATAPDGQSIDWLLLKPKDGTTPKGFFAGVKYIQRIATKGGRPPVTAPTGLNQVVSVPYTAIYRFTKQN